jgi:hypothetical protein
MSTPILTTQQQSEEKQPRRTSKGLSVKNKNKMCSILGFILYMKENGKMDEIEAKKMMEELPLYSTARVQSEFFDNEIFDLKKVEVELWKPMVIENKLIKKNAKKNKNNKKNGLSLSLSENIENNEEVSIKKTKSKPVKKVKVVEEVEVEVAETEVETEVETETKDKDKDKKNDNNKKRGRKAKKSIVKFNNDVGLEEDKPDQLEELLNDMLLDTSDEVKVNENDLDKVLRELEMEDFGGEGEEVSAPTTTPTTPPPSKKVSKKEKKDESQSQQVKVKVVKEKVKKGKN